MVVLAARVNCAGVPHQRVLVCKGFHASRFFIASRWRNHAIPNRLVLAQSAAWAVVTFRACASCARQRQLDAKLAFVCDCQVACVHVCWRVCARMGVLCVRVCACLPIKTCKCACVAFVTAVLLMVKRTQRKQTACLIGKA
jgi:hypothetical protein